MTMKKISLRLLSIRKGTLNENERGIFESHVHISRGILDELQFPNHLSNVPNYASRYREKLDYLILVSTDFCVGLAYNRDTMNQRFLRIIYLICLFLSLLFTHSCHNYPERIVLPASEPLTSVINQKGIQLGVCQGGMTNTEDEFLLMDSLGAEWIRNDFAWSRIEPEEDVWDFSFHDRFMENAVNHNKKVLILLVYDAPWIHTEEKGGRYISHENLPLFLNYVEAVALRYGDRAAGFEIWNEPNTPMFWDGTDAEFFELTRQTTALLKNIVPDKPVAVGSLFYHPIMAGKGFLKKMIEFGVLENADALSLHPYGLSLSNSAKRVSDADRLLKQSGYYLDIWITEIGTTTSGWYPNKTSVAGQAESVIHAVTELFAAGADLICWFKLLDGQMEVDAVPGISSEEFFGLAYPDYSLKPSGESYRLIASQLYQTVYDDRPIGLKGISPHTIKVYSFNGNDRSVKLVCFSNKRGVEVSISGFINEIALFNLISGDTILLEGQAPFQIGKDPVLIGGVLESEDSVIELYRIE